MRVEILFPILIVILILVGINLFLTFYVLRRNKDRNGETSRIFEDGIRNMQGELNAAKNEINLISKEGVNSISFMIDKSMKSFESGIKQMTDVQGDRLFAMNEVLSSMNKNSMDSMRDIHNAMNNSLGKMYTENTRAMDTIRQTMDQQLNHLRSMVDEKLQKTLEERISQSFRIVNESLEQVQRGLGEMQNLATGVGDLKKVLTHVKNRGIFGEIQLGNILKEILSYAQFEEQAQLWPGATVRVDYAIKMPAGDDNFIYLPIDSKYPGDTYAALMDAYENQDKNLIDSCRKKLASTIKKEAADIRGKYVNPPHTTDFAIMFLPTEGLYSEAISMGLLELLNEEYRITLAGPTTMVAILNSLHMGFKSLAIQKRSSEVWALLSEIKTEFGKFGEALTQAQGRIEKAHEDLEKLVGVRTRALSKKLDKVDVLDYSEEDVELISSNNSSDSLEG